MNHVVLSIVRRYIQNYDIDNLFDRLVELINKHINNESYVFQGLVSLSSCIASGNVKFYPDKLLSLLYKCTQYVEPHQIVFHRHRTVLSCT